MSGDGVSTIAADELVGRLDASPPFLLDVREPDEFADWRISGAVNIPVGQLAARTAEVPADREVVVICAKGARAAEGARILAGVGRPSRVLDGGMTAWASAYDTVEGEIGGATVVQVRRRGKGCLSYVVGGAGRAVVIDPSLEVARYERVAADHGWTITDVLDTHLHADHVSGARQLVADTGATLRLSPHDPFAYEFAPLSDGLVIEIGDGVGLTVSAVSVPGHTEGSTLFRLGEAAVFTGDTLFLESVGRPDLADQAEPFAHALFHSLHERVLPLGDEVLVFPAHYGDAVEVHAGQFVARPLGELRHTLPALAYREEEFVAWAVAHVKDRPPNYQQIVRINAGVEAVSAAAAEAEVGPNRCAIAS